MSTKGRDTSMKEKRGRSPTLPRKPEIRQHETRGRSPSLPRKTGVGQRGRSLNPPSILERKKTSTSIESRKVPTIARPSTSMSHGPSTRNPKKPLSPPKTKSLKRALDRPTPPSKVMSTKSKSNPKNIITSSMKTSGSIKPKASVANCSPLKSKNSINVKETNVSSKKQTSQTAKGLVSRVMAIDKKPIMPGALSSSQNDHTIYKKPIMLDSLSSSQKDHNVATLECNDIFHGEVNFEDGGEIPVWEPSNSSSLVGNQDMHASDICCDDNVSFHGSVDNKHIDDHDGHISQQDQVDETFDIISDHLDHHIANQEQNSDIRLIDENVEAKNEDIEETKLEDSDYEETKPEEQESEETKRDELIHEENKLSKEHEETDIKEVEDKETKPDEPEIQEDDVEVPTNEDTTSNMVIKNQEVVIHGKKDTATYNDVIEETVTKLREQSKNRVLALAGAFETVISLESDLSPKELSPKIY